MTDERAARFNDLMEQIEVAAYSIRTGGEHDIGLALVTTARLLANACEIWAEVSREALDKVTGHGYIDVEEGRP